MCYNPIRTLPEAQLVIFGALIVVESSDRNAGFAVIDQRVGYVIPFVVRLILERIILAIAAKWRFGWKVFGIS